MVLEYDEAVSVGTGNITIEADGAVVETIDVTDAGKVSIDGSTVTINPAANLPSNSVVSVKMDEGAIAFQSVTLFSEGFEDVPMQGFFSESEIEGGDADWSEEVPDGWELDNTTTPDGGPPEFFGWVIQNKDRWIATAGDQSRSEFTRGTGNVVVADGDEYDDGDGFTIGPNQMNTFSDHAGNQPGWSSCELGSARIRFQLPARSGSNGRRRRFLRWRQQLDGSDAHQRDQHRRWSKLACPC